MAPNDLRSMLSNLAQSKKTILNYNLQYDQNLNITFICKTMIQIEKICNINCIFKLTKLTLFVLIAIKSAQYMIHIKSTLHC